MAEILGFNVPINNPLAGAGSTIGMTITIGAIIVLVTIIIGISIWIWYQKKLFNKKVIVFENLGGQGFQKTGEDRARLVKIGDGGEEILFLQKRKSYKTAYGKKMGANTYWFAVGQDGYWYNCTLGDLDAKMGMLDIEPVDRDMRYMHVAIRKNIQDRYRKQNFMEKYGTILMQGLFLIIMLIGIWFLISKMGKTAEIINQGLLTTKDTMEVVKSSLSHVDTICSGGAGYGKA